MIYTGPTLRAFQIPLAHSGGQTESMCGWPLYGSMRDLGACRDWITGHNTGINLLLSTSAWNLLRPPIERRETRLTVWRKMVAQSSTLDQAGD